MHYRNCGDELRNVIQKALCIPLACMMLFGLTSCASVSKAERQIEKRAHIALDLSGCKIERETDSHGWMGDGESLLVLDCGGRGDAVLAQTGGWTEFPLSGSLQTVLYERGLAERNGIPPISDGVWYYYDRFPDSAVFDRRSDAPLLTRGAYNFSLLLYDADSSRLYYFELDT